MIGQSSLQSAPQELYVLLQALIAIAFGGVLGWQREVAGKWAGLRTHMLVCLASMLFVKIGQLLIIDAQLNLNDETLRTDPSASLKQSSPASHFWVPGSCFAIPNGTWRVD